mmetsp:Transcript_10279/g.9216  ORF Transcript_10279/g.9216 Transcript_10279/m.9216 type:complete len:122 (+) Transcript_10279:38-403(+)
MPNNFNPNNSAIFIDNYNQYAGKGNFQRFLAAYNQNNSAVDQQLQDLRSLISSLPSQIQSMSSQKSKSVINNINLDFSNTAEMKFFIDNTVGDQIELDVSRNKILYICCKRSLLHCRMQST